MSLYSCLFPVAISGAASAAALPIWFSQFASQVQTWVSLLMTRYSSGYPAFPYYLLNAILISILFQLYSPVVLSRRMFVHLLPLHFRFAFHLFEMCESCWLSRFQFSISSWSTASFSSSTSAGPCFEIFANWQKIWKAACRSTECHFQVDSESKHYQVGCLLNVNSILLLDLGFFGAIIVVTGALYWASLEEVYFWVSKQSSCLHFALTYSYYDSGSNLVNFYSSMRPFSCQMFEFVWRSYFA